MYLVLVRTLKSINRFAFLCLSRKNTLTYLLDEMERFQKMLGLLFMNSSLTATSLRDNFSHHIEALALALAW